MEQKSRNIERTKDHDKLLIQKVGKFSTNRHHHHILHKTTHRTLVISNFWSFQLGGEGMNNQEKSNTTFSGIAMESVSPSGQS